jgi:alanine racemase
MTRNTIARINLQAVERNFARVRQLAPSSAMVCVVKADAYGHGFANVWRALTRADVLAVATIGEAELCRDLGWRGRLLLLEGPANRAEFEELLGLDAEMVVHHETQLQLLKQRQHELRRPLWLKIDTGMHRLGFPAADATEAFKELSRLQGRDQIILMSHFACADDQDNPMTLRQMANFDEATVDLRGPVSLANSAGILNYADSRRDFVRPGIMLYGISPCRKKSASDIGLEPAMTLYCDLIAINRAQAGEYVGYGAAYTCLRDTRIGVGAIGYGDGYPRHARNGTPVLLNGKRAPLIGRVSMDMITIDLNGHPDAQVGDRITLWGEGLPIEEVAPWADAIPYQLICGVTARVRYQID